MRLLPFLLLAACYDGATTRVHVDLKAGTTHVVQHLHNAWPGEVGCEEKEGVAPTVASCVDGIRAKIGELKAELTTNGATVQKAGVILADGELDVLLDYTAKVGEKTTSEHGLTFLWMEERSPAQIKKGKAGKRHVALAVMPDSNGKDTLKVTGKYRQFTGSFGGDNIEFYLFDGKAADIVSEWTYAGTPDAGESPGAWLRTMPGLEDAIKASGLVTLPG